MVIFYGIFFIQCIGGCGKPCDEKIYTYEELIEPQNDQLVKVFIDNGLIIDDEFKEVFTEEEFQDYFNLEFDFLRRGITLRGHTMYFDLAKKTEIIYKKITGQESSYK